MFSVKTVFNNRIQEVVEGVRIRNEAAKLATKFAIQAEARRRVRKDTGKLRDSIRVTERGVETSDEAALPNEYGTKMGMRAQPFMRPAGFIGEAVFAAELTKEIREVAKRLPHGKSK